VESESREDAARHARNKLEQARSSLEGRDVAAEFVATVGPPAAAILRLAEERGADLIVVGTRRKRFFERLVEGSVLQEVVRRARCDVLVVA
jgi:nucleotide-binding universal stress UspA family protein